MQVLSPMAFSALAASAAGFILRLTYSTYRTENGVQVECDYRDFAPLMAGPVAIVLGVLTMASSSRPGRERSRELAVGALCVALGAFHLARGLGVLDFSLYSDPC